MHKLRKWDESGSKQEPVWNPVVLPAGGAAAAAGAEADSEEGGASKSCEQSGGGPRGGAATAQQSQGNQRGRTARLLHWSTILSISIYTVLCTSTPLLFRWKYCSFYCTTVVKKTRYFKPAHLHRCFQLSIDTHTHAHTHNPSCVVQKTQPAIYSLSTFTSDTCSTSVLLLN